jgi:hypothetical protein
MIINQDPAEPLNVCPYITLPLRAAGVAIPKKFKTEMTHKNAKMSVGFEI